MTRGHVRSLKKSVKQLDLMISLLEKLLVDEHDRLARSSIYKLAFKIDQIKDELTVWCTDGFIDC